MHQGCTFLIFNYDSWVTGTTCRHSNVYKSVWNIVYLEYSMMFFLLTVKKWCRILNILNPLLHPLDSQQMKFQLWKLQPEVHSFVQQKNCRENQPQIKVKQNFASSQLLSYYTFLLYGYETQSVRVKDIRKLSFFSPLLPKLEGFQK